MYLSQAVVRPGWSRDPIKRSGLICSNLPKRSAAAPSLRSEVSLASAISCFKLETLKDAATPKSSTSPKLVHKLQSPCSQKKKEQKENKEFSPLVDKPAPL